MHVPDRRPGVSVDTTVGELFVEGFDDLPHVVSVQDIGDVLLTDHRRLRRDILRSGVISTLPRLRSR